MYTLGRLPRQFKNAKKGTAFQQLARGNRWWRHGAYGMDLCLSVCGPHKMSPLDMTVDSYDNVHVPSPKYNMPRLCLPKKLNTLVSVGLVPPPPCHYHYPPKSTSTCNGGSPNGASIL